MQVYTSTALTPRREKVLFLTELTLKLLINIHWARCFSQINKSLLCTFNVCFHMHAFISSVFMNKKDTSRILWLIVTRDKDCGVTTNYFNFFCQSLLFKTIKGWYPSLLQHWDTRKLSYQKLSFVSICITNTHLSVASSYTQYSFNKGRTTLKTYHIQLFSIY